MNDYYSTGQETQTWLDFALECKYLSIDEHKKIHNEYGHIIAMILNMINNSEKWILTGEPKT
jgi:four helix bundle protein